MSGNKYLIMIILLAISTLYPVVARAEKGVPLIIHPEFVFGGLQGNGLEEFNEPDAVCFLPDGRLVAGDTINSRFKIYSFAPDGMAMLLVGSAGKDPGKFNCVFKEKLESGREIYHEVAGIAVNPDGLIYVIDQGNKRIQVFNSQGNVIPEKEISLDADFIVKPDPEKKIYFSSLEGLCFDHLGRLYLSDTGTNRVYRFHPDGSYDSSFTFQVKESPESEDYLFEEPESLKVWKDKLLVADENHSEIKVYDLETGYYTGFSFGKEYFSGDVEGIDILDSLLYAVDETGGRVCVFDLNVNPPAFKGAFGANGTEKGYFKTPDGLAVSRDGRYLAVADQGNYRIQVFNLLEIKQKLGLSVRQQD